MAPAVFPDAAASAGAVAVLHRAAKAQTIAGPLRRIGRQLNRQLQAQPLQLTNVFVNQAGQLTATGTMLGQSVLVPITNLTLTPQAGTSCQVLHLELGPIDLNLLGLRVQLSKVCLDVTATPGGGLLGDLLCNLTTPLSNSQLATLLTGLLPGINQALTRTLATGVRAPLSTTSSDIQPNPRGSCPVLHLQLGPVNLSLLGLNVSLTNCNNQPIILDITAIPSRLPGGGLLGDLLCALARRRNV
jgi:hypothetical protein